MSHHSTLFTSSSFPSNESVQNTPRVVQVVPSIAEPVTAEATSISASTGRRTQSIPILASKKKRIRFTETWDIFLLKSVTASDAHVAPHGEAGKRFEEARKLFLDAALPEKLAEISFPSAKTLRDRFNTIVEKRRIEVRQTAAASGIVENHGPQEELLDDVILAMGDEQERRREIINERTEKEKRLVDAGEIIRLIGVARARKAKDSTQDSESDFKNEKKESTPRKGKKRVLTTDSDSEEKVAIKVEIKRRQEVDEKRFKLEEARLELEEKRWTSAVERDTKRDENEDRRLAIEEKKTCAGGGKKCPRQRGKKDGHERKAEHDTSTVRFSVEA